MSKNSYTKIYRGGKQTRTTEVACGWVCQGHPNEVNAKTARHLRLCIICRSDPDAPARFIPEKFDGFTLVKEITKVSKKDVRELINQHPRERLTEMQQKSLDCLESISKEMNTSNPSIAKFLQVFVDYGKNR